MNPGGSDDEQAQVRTWVGAAKNGDASAFERLYRHHVGGIYGLCLRMSGDASQAEELTQRAFVRAFTRIEQFGGRSRFGTWLHRVAVNEVLMDRRQQKWPQLVDPDAEPDGQADRSTSSDPGTGMDLEAAIAELPNQARKVFVLRALYGHSHREIAELMGIAEASSKVHYHRARQALLATVADLDRAVAS